MMAGPCASPLPDTAFLQGVIGFIDCKAQSIGEYGYQALAAPGSPVSMALTATMTLFIGLFGFRLLLGNPLDMRSGVVAAIKLGVVLALATSWPAFRTLAYDVALRGPAEIGAAIGGPADIPGAQGGLVARLQGVDYGLIELTVRGTGIRAADIDTPVPGPNQQFSPAQLQEQYRRGQLTTTGLRGDPTRDTTALALARTIYLTGVIGAFGSVRLIAGLLLALAPLFALFLLFDHTRGLFEGWIRGLAGTAIGALFTSIILGVELALVEPWLYHILADRRAALPTPSVPGELLVTTLGFALAVLAGLIASARLAHGLRFPDARQIIPADWMRMMIDDRGQGSPPLILADGRTDQRSRAYAVADAVAAMQRRETVSLPVNRRSVGDTGRAAIQPRSGAVDIGVLSPVPLGQSHRRRTAARVSARAATRDGTT